MELVCLGSLCHEVVLDSVQVCPIQAIYYIMHVAIPCDCTAHHLPHCQVELVSE